MAHQRWFEQVFRTAIDAAENGLAGSKWTRQPGSTHVSLSTVYIQWPIHTVACIGRHRGK
jgi:hypothetical protein